jgi:hypothetical protein
MLRRSFAEFHAQRAQPGKSAALAAGQARLAQYQAAAWPACIKGCSRCVIGRGWGRGGGGTSCWSTTLPWQLLQQQCLLAVPLPQRTHTHACVNTPVQA